jgi:UDP-N-acetylmuramate dehydrogenase
MSGGRATTAGADAAARAGELLGDLAQRDVPIGPMTTYRVGGAADVFVDVASEDDLLGVARAVSSTGAPVLVVGRGSNLLVADSGFHGVAVHLGDAFSSIDIEGTTVRAGGAVRLPVLARRTAAASLTGLEWAVGVPGSVGGAVRMNAGGHGAETRETLRRIRRVDLRTGADVVVDAGALDLAYRHSNVTPAQVVVWAEYELAPGDGAASESQISEIVRWRRENQPGGQNCGSVFTNPDGDSAGRLVDAAGLKGHRRGTAFVSPKHANFIQADDGGLAADVRDLIADVQQAVEERFGVRLVPELRMVGFDET